MHPTLAVSLSPWLSSHWGRSAILLLGLVLFGLAFWQRRRVVLASLLGGVGATLGLMAIGGLLFPATARGFFSNTAGWLLAVSLAGLIVMAALLFLMGFWSRPLAFIVPAVGLVGLGGLLLSGVEYDLRDLGQSIAEMRIRSPWWLLLFALVPVVVLVGRRRLTRTELRPWLAMGLRVLGVSVLAFALAEPFFSQASRAMTVLFVLDRSLSIPEDPGEDPARPGERVDLRSRRIVKFINQAVQMRGSGHERDRAGLIVFGRRPRLDLLPGDAPHFNLPELPDIEDGTYTDIGSALKLAMASFPEGTARRVVLISDGNENLGNALEQAQLAESLGVQIDVVPLGGGKRNEEEILVERVDAPPVIEQGARLPIRVLVRSHNPRVVVGRLTLRQITDREGEVKIKLAGTDLGVDVAPLGGEMKGVGIRSVRKGSLADRSGLEKGDEIIQVNGQEVNSAAELQAALANAKGEARLALRRNPRRIVGEIKQARLQKGLNDFPFERPLTDEQRSYSYEAQFEPLWIEDGKGNIVQKGVPGDRVQNNRASTHVVARGQGRVLLLESKAGDHRELADALARAGKERFKVTAAPVAILANYQDRDKLAVFLSNFDCVILANIPAESISEEQQEIIRSNTHDQGCGLVMIGGPDGYGAGGWANTAIEEAMPVEFDVKSLKVVPSGALVLVLDTSGSMAGEKMELTKAAAVAAMKALGENDYFGVVSFDSAARWIVEPNKIGNRDRTARVISRMGAWGGTDMMPGLEMGYDGIRRVPAAVKHVIVLTDGRTNGSGFDRLAARMKQAGITTTSVAIGVDSDSKLLQSISRAGGGKFYQVNNPKMIPRIFIREAMIVKRPLVYEDKNGIATRQVYPHKIVSGLGGKLPPVNGYVMTTVKEHPLVEQIARAEKPAGHDNTLLAAWQYGLGRSVAFTSDAGLPKNWSREWIARGIFARFWEQAISWTLRPVESGNLIMVTEQRDGKIRVIVVAREDGKPATNLKLRGGLSRPGGKGGEPGEKVELRFVQKNSGQYEAEVRAAEAGSYFVTAQATRVRQKKDKDGKVIGEVMEGTDSVRAGVTLPYSPEFMEQESNSTLMENLASVTDGLVYEDDADVLAEVAKAGTVFRDPEKRSWSSLPFHYWLLFLAAGLLLLDVAVRRLAFDPDATKEQANYIWARLRGFPVPPPRPAETLRLRARPDAVTPSERAARRFEGGGVTGVPGIADASAPAAPARPRPGATPGQLTPQEGQQSEGESLEALREAKKRVWKAATPGSEKDPPPGAT